MKPKRTILFFLFPWAMSIIVVLLSAISFAEIPQRISYQGYLTDVDGNPLDATLPVTFAIYDAASGGSALWVESQIVDVNKGVYNVMLGAVELITLPFDSQYWLAIKVDTDDEMKPRQAFTSAGYAINADTVDGFHSSDFAAPSHTHSGSDIVSGTIDLLGSTTGSIIKGSNIGIGYGVFGSSTGTWSGVHGRNNNNMGAGVRGDNTAFGYGVYGVSDGYGVYGSSKSQSGYGVYGVSEGIGVYGRSDSNYAGYFEGNLKTTGNMTVEGNVGIGIPEPNEKLSVFGIIESTSGGVKFPDGTIQSTSISSHTADVSAHHTKTTNASELTSGLLPNARIANGAITTAKIADDAVTNAKLGANSVGSDQILDGAVSPVKVSPNFIQNILGLELLSSTNTVGNSGGPPTRAAINLTCPSGKAAIACGFQTDQNIWHIEAARPLQDRCIFAFTTCVYLQGGGFVCPYGSESVYLTATCINSSTF